MSEQARRQKVALPHLVVWFLFGQGGLVAALFLPVHVLVQGILAPLGLVHAVDQRYDTFAPLLANWLVKLYLFVLISLPLWHWAHRFRYFLVDLKLSVARTPGVAIFMYGLAALGMGVTAYILVRVP
ncbi:MAG TPA: fumarate reductase subunit FrdD [Candidatus Acidoferrales bacterium]|nr:fumarate reductase subunit FrdD [Candidatus Acidoferrales bacterium]